MTYDLQLISILTINFLIGAIALFVFIRKKKIESAKQQKAKYFYYLLIVSSMLLYIRFLEDYIYVLFAMILLIGFYEIIKISKYNKNVLIISLLMFLVFGFFFINFSLKDWKTIAWVYSLVVIFDGYSQLCGQLFGKHLIIPKISPRKTIEGVAGGLILTYLSAFFIKAITAEYLLLVFIVIISSFIGDLLASYLKRIMKVKDYSDLIPGHGGILDRFDGFIFSGFMFGLISVFYEISI